MHEMLGRKMNLTDFKALSLDCYGTLIDWETGIYTSFRPILDRLPPNHLYLVNPTAIIERFSSLQASLEVQHPGWLYADILAACYKTISTEEGIASTENEEKLFGNSVRNWPAFTDSVAGLQKLKKYYKLIILSNVDNNNIRGTLTGPLSGVEFDAIYTAEDIKTYKPNHRNFNYLIDLVNSEFGLQRTEILHAAKSLTADHASAKEIGLTSAWIARGDKDGVSAMGGRFADLKDTVSFSWSFSSVGEMADAVEGEFQRLAGNN